MVVVSPMRRRGPRRGGDRHRRGRCHALEAGVDNSPTRDGWWRWREDGDGDGDAATAAPVRGTPHGVVGVVGRRHLVQGQVAPAPAPVPGRVVVVLVGVGWVRLVAVVHPAAAAAAAQEIRRGGRPPALGLGEPAAPVVVVAVADAHALALRMCMVKRLLIGWIVAWAAHIVAVPPDGSTDRSIAVGLPAARQASGSIDPFTRSVGPVHKYRAHLGPRQRATHLRPPLVRLHRRRVVRHFCGALIARPHAPCARVRVCVDDPSLSSSPRRRPPPATPSLACHVSGGRSEGQNQKLTEIDVTWIDDRAKGLAALTPILCLTSLSCRPAPSDARWPAELKLAWAVR